MNNTSSTASSLETEMEIIRQKYEKELQSMRKEVEDCKTTIQNLKTSEESLSNTNKDIVSQVYSKHYNFNNYKNLEVIMNIKSYTYLNKVESFAGVDGSTTKGKQSNGELC